MSTPSAPQIVVRPRAFDGELQFWWSTPASNGGSAITGYTLECAAISFSQALSSSTYTYRVSGLTNFTDYTFTLKASNGNGAGPAATFRTVQPCTLLGAPTDLSANIVGLNGISAEWTNAAFGGRILRNVVKAVPTDNSGTVILSTYGDITTRTFSGLDTTKSYRIRVKGFADSGYSQELVSALISFGVLPSDISGLVMWLDGKDQSTLFSDASGNVPLSGNVLRWEDKSGQGNHVFQQVADIGLGPILYGNASYDAVNGYVAFDLSGGALITDVSNAISFFPNNEGTIFVVHKFFDAAPPNQYALYALDVSGNELAKIGRLLKSSEYLGSIDAPTEGNFLYGETGILTATPIVTVGSFDLSECFVYLGNKQTNSLAYSRLKESSNYLMNMPTNYIVGAQLSESVGDHAVGAVIAYNRKLSDTERKSVQTYIQNAFGVNNTETITGVDISGNPFVDNPNQQGYSGNKLGIFNFWRSDWTIDNQPVWYKNSDILLKSFRFDGLYRIKYHLETLADASFSAVFTTEVSGVSLEAGFVVAGSGTANSRFFGKNTRVDLSMNATTWDTFPDPSGTVLQCIATNGQFWVAGSANTPCAMLSANGEYYSKTVSLDLGTSVSAVATNGTIWVASGQNGKMFRSTDLSGETWTEVTGFDTVMSGGARSFAFGEDTSGNQILVGTGYPFNGSNPMVWFDVSGGDISGSTIHVATSMFNSNGGYGVAFGKDSSGNNLWVAVGTNNYPSSCIYSSTDGKTWTGRGNPFGGGTSDSGGYSVAYGNGMWVVGAYTGSPGNGATLAYSLDGITWTVRSNIFSSRVNTVSWDPYSGYWLAAGVDTASNRKFSGNGIIWAGISNNGLTYANTSAPLAPLPNTGGLINDVGCTVFGDISGGSTPTISAGDTIYYSWAVPATAVFKLVSFTLANQDAGTTVNQALVGSGSYQFDNTGTFTLTWTLTTANANTYTYMATITVI